MDKLKRIFLQNEIWLLTFGGAFQRANIYKPNVPTEKRNVFRRELKKFVEEHILPQYKEPVCEFSHVLNLEGIIVFSEKYHEILNNGKLLLGVSQKLLNLVLKYYWCLGEIAEPPHCPVDRIIQQKGLKSKYIVNWTSMDDVDEYLSIIHKIKQVAEESGQTIAEWELEIFGRRSVY